VYSLPVRLVLGTGGTLAGAYGGGLVGFSFAPRNCGCEFEGLNQAAVGAAIGSVITAAVLAGLPEMGSTCSTGQRIGHALLGSLSGAAVGSLGGVLAGPGGVFFGYLGGSSIGSTLGAAMCEKH
jgi:hypothetical protein